MKKINFGKLDWKQKIEVLEKDESLYSKRFRSPKLLKLFLKKMRKLMAKGDKRMDRRQIKTKLKYWGGKGGSDLGTLTVAGYGETKKGNYILYAIFGSHILNEDNDTEIINSLINTIFEELDGDL